MPNCHVVLIHCSFAMARVAISWMIATLRYDDQVEPTKATEKQTTKQIPLLCLVHSTKTRSPESAHELNYVDTRPTKSSDGPTSLFSSLLLLHAIYGDISERSEVRGDKAVSKDHVILTQVHSKAHAFRH